MPIARLGILGPTLLVLATCSSNQGGRQFFALDDDASGVVESVDNVANLTVVSKDPNDLRAEYRAGFVQGKLQRRSIRSARDNDWDQAYLTDPGHGFPRQPGPTPAELDLAARILNRNYDHLVETFLPGHEDAEERRKLTRLLFRMLGVYHGATRETPADLDFSGAWLPDGAYLTAQERALGYETDALTFMDVYFLNAYADLMDAVASSPELGAPVQRPGKCSAFLKRTGDDVVLTHNTWNGFLAQSMAMTLFVNGDLLVVNASTPGMLASGTDFGFNGKGILFNETTHRASTMAPRVESLWTLWRAALAEQFSASIDDFFRYLSLDQSGTYLNGYMLVDANRNETGLAEMSYRCFVFYRSAGGPYEVTSRSVDGGECSTEYDAEMVTPDYIMGINYPASIQVRTDLGSTDNRPARKRQLAELLPGVGGVEDAKSVITYTDPANPLSIFGRWDLGYGETPYPKMVPDGSIDAKVAAASMVRAASAVTGVLDVAAPTEGFWMRFGTAHVNGSPFVWSRSRWSWQKLRDVPDVVDGRFRRLPLHLR